MPGLVGVAFEDPSIELSALFNRMTSSISYNNTDTRDVFVCPLSQIAMGRVSLGVLNAYPQPLSSRDGSISLVFDGELFADHPGVSDAQHVLDLYLELGDRCVERLDGTFNCSVLDRKRHCLVVFNDIFGLLPLYYSVICHRNIAFCSEVKGILEVPGVDRTRDDEAIADCLTFGYPLGNKSLFKNIPLIGPGSILTFDLSSRQLRTTKYWDYKSLFATRGLYDTDVRDDDVVDALIKAVRKRSATHRDVLGLSLSGGLDTRSILAALQDHACGTRSYTLGLRGCQDELFAGALARIAGTDHEFVELGAQYLMDFESISGEMIRLSDGMFFPHEATELLALEYFKKRTFRVLIRGHGGEMGKASLAYPPMSDMTTKQLTRRYDILTQLFNKVNLVSRDVRWKDLCTPDYYRLTRNAAYHSLEDACGLAVDTMSPVDSYLYYYLDAYIRRFGVLSLSIFRSQVDIRMPYVDRDFLDKLLKIPPERRWIGEIHKKTVARCQPAMTKVPDSNTGAPLDVDPVRLFLIDKYTSVLRKLSVAGYRHYNEFQKWQREQFRDAIERIIFSKQARERGIFNMPFLRNIFQRHIAGVGEHGHLLGTAVGIELWHRQFVDC
jgi:asparagine synthase (glutamine-hydrolysing)